MTARYIVGDVFDGLRFLDDDSVDLIISSPPFLALRSYLPAGDPNKGKEIGSESTPADYLDVLLDVVQECRRVLAPHGSLVFELGDTYAGSGGAGGDYTEAGMRAGQERFTGSATEARRATFRSVVRSGEPNGGAGWPLSKSLCGIPTLFAWSLAYGRNLLRPERTVEPWRIRNLIAWVRPNPPVGALGDKFRPATSYLTVACTGPRRWFDLDAVRTEHVEPESVTVGKSKVKNHSGANPRTGWETDNERIMANPAGAPPLDWWEIPTEPYSGSHYATWPRKLLDRPILAMCPRRVCTVCGEPSRRIVENPNAGLGANQYQAQALNPQGIRTWDRPHNAERNTLGWSDCGHGPNNWRSGVVLDPFAGSGTTLAVAVAHGRQAIGIDIDPRNAELAYDRVGMWLTVETVGTVGAT